MLNRYLLTMSVLTMTWINGCNGDDTTAPSDAGSGGGAGAGLHWYMTCGDPVCRVPDDATVSESGVTMCSAGQSSGEPCAQTGVSCGDPDRNCGAVLLCTDHDPKVNGCPISSRRLKRDIVYLSPTEVADLGLGLSKIRLATYRYKQGDAARHLGFIIEDSPDIPASDIPNSRVDLYAYTSMAVAALQVQAREIERLEADVDALSNEVEALSRSEPRRKIGVDDAKSAPR